MKDLKIRSSDLHGIGFILVTVGLFFLPRSIRLGLSGTSLGALNIFPLIGCVLIIIRNRGIKLREYIILAVMFFLMFLAEYEAGLANLSVMLPLFINMLMPLVLLCVYHYELSDSLLSTIMKLMNFSVILTFACGMIDKLTSNMISGAVAQFSKDPFFILISNNDRLFTWYGHFLYTGEIFLIFYIINLLYYRKVLNKKEPIYLFIISLFGVLLVASKTCTVIILLLFLLLNIKKIQYTIAGCAVVTALYATGVFDLVLLRFSSGDLTTGRSESLDYLLSMNANLFPLFIGNGTDYIAQLSKSYSIASAGLEYVLIMFSAFFGVVFTAILAYLCFIRPIARFIKRKDIVTFFCFIALMIDVNSYNGLAVFQDQMYAFAWAAALMGIFSQRSSAHIERTMSIKNENKLSINNRSRV